MTEILNLPLDLKERREVLEKALAETVSKIIAKDLKEDLLELLTETNFKFDKITFNFYPEGNDEGGTVYYPTDLSFYLNGEYIELDDEEYQKEIEVKSKWSESIYTYDLADYIKDSVYDILSNYREDLYDYDVYEIYVEEDE